MISWKGTYVSALEQYLVFICCTLCDVLFGVPGYFVETVLSMVLIALNEIGHDARTVSWFFGWGRVGRELLPFAPSWYQATDLGS